LLYDGQRRVHHADNAMARITAERLIRNPARAGFVLMREPPGAMLTMATILIALLISVRLLRLFGVTSVLLAWI
jgi:hypothetical protein